MKTMRGLLAGLFVMVASVSVLAEDALPPQIVVKGEAEILLEPDYIEWVVLVKASDLSPEVAFKTNERLLEALREIAKDVDINAADISAGRALVEQRYSEERGRDSKGQYAGTDVTRRVTLLMRDMDKLEEMLPQLGNLGLSYLMRYRSTKYDQAIRQVKIEALKQAQQIAIEEAAVIGQKIGPALHVEVQQDYPNRGVGSLFAGIDEPIEFDYSSAEQDGKIHVSAYAEVEFSLE